jgi:putative membrane protein
MKATHIGPILTTAVVLLLPGALPAQIPSIDGQPIQQQQQDQQQQRRQQQQPGVNQSARNNNMQDSAPNSGVSGQMMKDKIFLRKAAQGGLAEVQLGQLASNKASSQEVKDFGAKMVKDHTDLNDQMKPVAESMGVMLPKKLSASDQAEFDKLNGLSGTDFDNEYLAYMVKDHHDDLREFRTEAAATSDPTLKDAVEKGARVIREHMIMVDGLARSRGLAVPTRGPRPTAPAAQ